MKYNKKKKNKIYTIYIINRFIYQLHSSPLERLIIIIILLLLLFNANLFYCCCYYYYYFVHNRKRQADNLKYLHLSIIIISSFNKILHKNIIRCKFRFVINSVHATWTFILKRGQKLNYNKRIVSNYLINNYI